MSFGATTQGGHGDLIRTTSDDSCKMFVGALSWDTDEIKLKDYFSQFGEVKDCNIKKDMTTGKSRGFGFVLFADQSSVAQVLANRNHILDGKKIDPKKAKTQGQEGGKLFVGGLKSDTSEDTIRDYFMKFGTIEAIERPRDHDTQRAKGFCFITFSDAKTVREVIHTSQFHTIDGRQCECKDGVAKSKFKQQQQEQQQQQDTSGYGGYGGYGNNQYPGYNTSGYGGYGYGYGYATADNSGQGYGDQSAVQGTDQSNNGYNGYNSSYAGYGGYGGYGTTTGANAAYGNTNYYQGYNQPAAPTQNQQPFGGKAPSSVKTQNSYKPY